MLIVIIAAFLVGCAYKPEPILPANQVKLTSSDSLEVLADKYDVTVKELIEYNGIKYPYHIKVGQILRIPEINDESELELEDRNSGALIGRNAIKPKVVQNLREDYSNEEEEEVASKSAPKNVNGTPMNELAKALEKKRKLEQVSKKIELEQAKNDIKNDESDDIEPIKAPKNKAKTDVKPIETESDDDIEPSNNPNVGKSELNDTTEEPKNEKKEVKKEEPKQEKKEEEKEDFRAPLADFSNITLNPKSKRLRLKAKNNPVVYAVGSGKVFVSPESYPDMGGRVVVVKHDVNGQTFLSIYGGMKDIDPAIVSRKKQFIRAGERLGDLGITKDKQHILNFELMKDNVQIIPGSLIKALRNNVKTVIEQPVKAKKANLPAKKPRKK